MLNMCHAKCVSCMISPKTNLFRSIMQRVCLFNQHQRGKREQRLNSRSAAGSPRLFGLAGRGGKTGASILGSPILRRTAVIARVKKQEINICIYTYIYRERSEDLMYESRRDSLVDRTDLTSKQETQARAGREYKRSGF